MIQASGWVCTFNKQKQTTRRAFAGILLLAAVILFGSPGGVSAAYIVQPWDIAFVQDASVTASGNGSLDWIMFSGTNTDLDNVAGTNNFDNVTSNLDPTTWAESNVTSGADLKEFYNLNFGYTQTGQTEIVFFLNLNESGNSEQEINTLDRLDIYLNPTTINGVTTSPYQGDTPAAQQEAINQTFTGGTLTTTLYTEPFDNLPIAVQGPTFADYVIRTGIDPFTLSDSDIVLTNISMSDLNNGADEWFLSGSYAYNDFPPDLFTPEPATGILMGIGLAGLAYQRRRRPRKH